MISAEKGKYADYINASYDKRYSAEDLAGLEFRIVCTECCKRFKSLTDYFAICG
jgi:hypothetical protein